MSMCLVVETKDYVWFGGDTAISYEINGKRFRGRNEEYEKAFRHANAVFMCGGTIRNALSIRKYIESFPKITQESIYKISSMLKDITKEDHIIDPTNEIKTVLIMALLDNGRVYGMSEIHDFAIENPIIPELTDFKSVCCIGIYDEDSNRGNALSNKYYAETKDVIKTYQKVYSDLSSNGVGGHVTLYQLDIKNQTIIKYIADISESGIEYINASAIMNGGSIGWDYVNSDPKTTQANTDINRIVNGKYVGGTFIDGTRVASPTIEGGTMTAVTINGSTINGAKINIAGNSNDSYFRVYDNNNNLYGYIRYDSEGIPSENENKYRMFISTTSGKALKIQSGENLSITAAGYIHMGPVVEFAGELRGGDIDEMKERLRNLNNRIADLENIIFS